MSEEKPTLESEKKEYSETTLPSYLEYDQWTHEETLLIFCDCDPQFTTISWVANGAAHGTSTGQNVLENAQLFREWAGMRHIPLEIQTSVLQHPALTGLDIPTATQEDWEIRGGIVARKVNRKPVDEVAWKWIHCIQIGFNLAKAHEALMRKSPEVDKRQLEQFNNPIKKPVGWWIDWAKRHDVSVPWLAWAEENDLIPETPPEFDLEPFGLKGFNYSIPSPIQKFIQEQHDLLKESKDVITRLQSERKDDLSEGEKKTVLNIIYALKEYALKGTRKNQSGLIEELEEHFPELSGATKRSLERWFAKANKQQQ